MVRHDNPQAYLAGDRRRALAQGRSMPDRVVGAALFADISGFTPLTEALAAELGPLRGADELTTVLDTVFAALLSRVHAYGGEVIYFSGDAITCWLDDDDGLRAVACGLELARVPADLGEVRTPSGRVVRLGVKVAVAVGSARRFVVGDPAVQLIDVLAGRLVDRLAAAEGRAGVGEVVLDESALASLGTRVRLRTRTGDARGRRDGAVAEALAVPPPPPVRRPPLADLPEDVVRRWVLPAVYARIRFGRGEFLAELRPAVPLFLSFGGIDYDDDPAAPELLDAFVVQAQRVIDAYGGSTLQLTLGDKGAWLYAVFGSPLAHEDDAARACAAALELRALDGRTATRVLAVGIASGRLRSGSYGHPDRRTFCCLGDAVNLAARLTAGAGPGQVYVSGQARRATADRFAWQPLPPMTVKGKAEPVEVFALRGPAAGTGERAARMAVRFTEPLLGRTRELAVLSGRLDAALAGRGQVVDLVAEAGLGKSRLVTELVRSAARRGVAVHVGDSPAFGATSGYAAWRQIWWDLLDLGDAPDPPAEGGDSGAGQLARRLAARLGAVDPALVARVPLLATLLDLAIEDTALTRGFDAKLRKTSLEDLLSRVLVHRAAVGPLALVVEDAHRMDPLSLDLLACLTQASVALPVLIVLARRPGGAAPTAGDVDTAAGHTAVPLGPLPDDVAAALVRARAPAAADALVERVVERAQGNPFYLEELAGYLRRAAAPGGDSDVAELPESLTALVLSRVDTLAEGPRTTAKVASVVGGRFDPGQLRGVHPALGTPRVVTRCLDRLRAAELTRLEDAAALQYSFRNAIVRDVVYDSLPFAVRARLHEQAGDHAGATGLAGSDQLLDLLAYHYGHGANEAKKRDALLAAGRAAQARYANATAIGHYRAVLPLVSVQERGGVLLALGRVLELTGAWPQAQEAFIAARDLATGAGDGPGRAWADAALAEIDRKQGRFADARQRLDQAGAAFESAGDQVGAGRVLHLSGTLAAQQGDYDAARAAYLASLELRTRLGDTANMAALLSNLAVIAEYTGDYPQAGALNTQALALREGLGDRWAIAVSQNNLGMIALLLADYPQARDRFAEAMRLHLQVGDAWMVAIAQHNLANAARGLGDLTTALRQYALALTAYRRWDDRWAIAILLEDLAVTAVRLGDRAAALALLGAAERRREELGSPRTPSTRAELAAAVGTGPDDEAGLAHGRTMDLTAAVQAALAVCEAAQDGAEPADGPSKSR